MHLFCKHDATGLKFSAWSEHNLPPHPKERRQTHNKAQHQNRSPVRQAAKSYRLDNPEQRSRALSRFLSLHFYALYKLLRVRGLGRLCAGDVLQRQRDEGCHG